MRTLDRSKPFGSVHGGDAKHRFEQGGLLFDAAGNEMPGGAAAAPVAPSVVIPPAPPFSPEQQEAAGTALAGNAESAIAEVGDMSDGVLKAARVVEAAGKNRKTVLAAIDEQVASRKLGGDQVGAQLGE